MYKIVTKEDTIRIPAEYMRKGASLNDHIDRLSMTAFEGRFDEQNRFILVTSNHEPLGRGRIIHGDGAIYQKVRFDAVLFCMDDYEVVEGAVSEVNEFGAFGKITRPGLFTNRWSTRFASGAPNSCLKFISGGRMGAGGLRTVQAAPFRCGQQPDNPATSMLRLASLCDKLLPSPVAQ